MPTITQTIRLKPNTLIQYRKVGGRAEMLRSLGFPETARVELLEWDGEGLPGSVPSPQREGPLVRITYEVPDDARDTNPTTSNADDLLDPSSDEQSLMAGD